MWSEGERFDQTIRSTRQGHRKLWYDSFLNYDVILQKNNLARENPKLNPANQTADDDFNNLKNGAFIFKFFEMGEWVT